MRAAGSPSRRATNALVFFGSVAAALLWVLGVYLAYLHHRLSVELLDEQWKTPVEIYSSITKTREPFVRVYGIDWRATTPVEITALPPHVGNAFIAAEDVRFRRHIGVDPIGVARAIFTNVKQGSIAQGGSTIDQQLIKAKFLTQKRTFRRKIVEAVLALILDARLTKDQILEAYLNDVYLGHFRGRPVLGIDEAARLYFDKSPARLSVSEAALLAGIVRAPNRDTPDKRPDLARARRDAILKVMRDHKWISDQEFREAKSDPVRFRWGSVPTSQYEFALSVVRREVVRRVGERAMRQGGLKILCEIDPRMQQQAEKAARRGVAALQARYSWIAAQSRKQPLQVAILSVDPANGGIRAVVGGSDPRISSFDRTIQMKRQPGSAFKTFAYLAAIERKKFTNSSLLLDTPVTIELASGKKWEPHNYDQRYRGRVTLREAFEKSLNVPTIRMADRLGWKRIEQTVERFNFSEDFEPIPSLPLGVTEVTVRELTAAYTAFPNLGREASPFLLTRVESRKGKVLYEHEVKMKRVAEPDATFVVHSLLRGVVKRGTASRLRRYGLSFVAGKTGTTNDYRDAWFVGYSPDLVTTVWVGYDNGAPLRLSSAEAAIPIWGSYMSNVKLEERELERPDGVVVRDVDPETGFLWREGCPGPVRETFLSGTAPSHHCPAGVPGRILRRIIFDDDVFDEPPAITFEQFRRWTEEVDRSRQDVEDGLDRLRRIFEGDVEEPRERSRGRKRERREDG